MGRYVVKVIQTIHSEAEVEVQAADKDEAFTLARQAAARTPTRYTWEETDQEFESEEILEEPEAGGDEDEDSDEDDE